MLQIEPIEEFAGVTSADTQAATSLCEPIFFVEERCSR